MRASETASLYFDNCRIPKDNLLGQKGEGFIQAMKILDGGRISIAALSIGIGKELKMPLSLMQMSANNSARRFVSSKA